MSFFLFQPYLYALFLAAILRIVCAPLHAKILSLTGERQNVAAFLSVLTMLIFIILPLSLAVFFLFDDVGRFYSRIVSGGGDFSFVENIFSPVRDFIRNFIPDFSADPVAYAREGLSFVVAHIGSVFSRFVSLVFNFFLMLLALFYLFRDGSRFRKYIVVLSPLSNRYDESILNRLTEAVSSVVKGSLLVALIQGVLAGGGFAIFGVPNPVLWGAVATIAALVPNFGTMLVLLPAIAFLFWSGHVMPAVGLLLWSSVVGLVDNLLAPHLMTRGLRVHPLLILLSVLGGFALFGPLGFLAGPVLVTFLITLLDMYPSIVAGEAGPR